MRIKPVREWKTISKGFFLALGFFAAMFFFPVEESVPVNADITVAKTTAPRDFFSVFREEREQRRGEKTELYRELLATEPLTEEERTGILAEMETFLRKNAMEDKVETILKGRGYQDVIFSYEDTLSLLILKDAALDGEEKNALLRFLAVYSGVVEENISVFSISA